MVTLSAVDPRLLALNLQGPAQNLGQFFGQRREDEQRLQAQQQAQQEQDAISAQLALALPESGGGPAGNNTQQQALSRIMQINPQVGNSVLGVIKFGQQAKLSQNADARANQSADAATQAAELNKVALQGLRNSAILQDTSINTPIPERIRGLADAGDMSAERALDLLDKFNQGQDVFDLEMLRVNTVLKDVKTLTTPPKPQSPGGKAATDLKQAIRDKESPEIIEALRGQLNAIGEVEKLGGSEMAAVLGLTGESAGRFNAARAEGKTEAEALDFAVATATERTSLATTQAAVTSLEKQLDEWLDFVDKNGGQFLPGTVEAQEALTRRRAIQLNLKEAFNLGVLNGPDLALMNDVLADTGLRIFSLSPNIAPLLGNSAERTKISVDTLKGILRDTVESKQQALGLGGVGTPPDSASAPLPTVTPVAEADIAPERFDQVPTATGPNGEKIILQNGQWVRQ